MEKVTNYSGDSCQEKDKYELKATPAIYENSHVFEKMIEELTKQNQDLVEENEKLLDQIVQYYS
jgi:hypothetical protein